MKLVSFIKKEFHRFFHDPRLIVTMLIPGILIYVLYSIMGGVINSEDESGYTFKAYLSGDSAVVSVIESTIGDDWHFIKTDDLETAKKEVEDGEATALLVFPEGFDEAVASYMPSSDTPAPSVRIFYRALGDDSAAFYQIVVSILDLYEEDMANKFDVSPVNFSTETDFATTFASALLPFIVVVFIFSACMSITLESVAGEKERGTLSTVLVTSVKRSHIALGKVIPLSCIAAIGATSSFLGVSLSLPKLMGVSLGSVFGSIGFVGFLLLFLLILSVVPLIVSLITVVSAYAKSVKEASAYTSVVMILMMVLSLASAFVQGIGAWAVAVPILNAVVCMQGILSLSVSVWQSLVSVAANIVYTALLILLIAKMLSSERIMFGR